MATASQGNLTLNLGSLEQALAKASRITENSMREMQQKIEDAGKKVSASAAAALQVTSGQFKAFQKAYDPATDAAEKFIQKNARLVEVLKQSQGAQNDFGGSYTERAGLTFPAGGAYADAVPKPSGDEAVMAFLNDEKTRQVKSNFAEMTQLLDDWRQGASSAFEEYSNKAGTAAEQSKAVFSSAFEKMDQAVLTFATTGKFNFSDFATSVLKDMATMAAKTAASSALSSLFGLASSALSAWWSGGAPTTTQVGPYTNTFNPQMSTNGLTPYGSPLKFAKGGAFTNSVAAGPTVAPMALFGEAGPEAIMPLSRGSDGSLGVRALGGSQTGSTSSNQVVIQQTINVADGQGSGTDTNAQNVARAYAGSARQGAAEQIARDLKPGGQIWSAINGR
ncbi:Phage tail length tape-measure protein 1 [Pseudomonas sp. R4-34-07]|uniref:phage tail tape measure C-terminal domain-containing protein n=1 Tax=Pseudomonas sp. R4-34-07 TaxID=658642 RepID=UPI000F57FC56|nr:phage tail tape measure C-terminal domain-containing protein [Pseudomonas sp. R4-34-07]AZF51637.1 Phage tail length tape-measure protein 1 [Pseudomonas sp. R4-34-07]